MLFTRLHNKKTNSHVLVGSATSIKKSMKHNRYSRLTRSSFPHNIKLDNDSHNRHYSLINRSVQNFKQGALTHTHTYTRV